MSAPPYMPLYVGDYLSDTTHLTCTEHGAYLLLLMAMWRAGGTLPNDDARLARFSHCTRGQWERMRPVLIEFFTASDETLTHRRLTHEMTRHGAAVEQRRQAASNGGKAKALKDKERRLPDAMPKTCQPEPEPIEDTSEAKASSVGAAKSNDRGSRIPADWSPTPEQLDYAVSEGLTDFSARREAGKFLDYWRNVPGAKGRKLDWNLTWKRWAQTAAERQPTNERPHHNRPSTKLEHLADIGAAMRAAVGPGGA